MADQLVSADPTWTGAQASPNVPRMSAAHADSALPASEDAVTLGDLKADPVAAMTKIGAIVKKDASDPRLWLGLAASYFAPKLFDVAAPVVARAATKTAAMGGAAFDALDPDLVSIASPRAGAALKKAQQLKEYLASRPPAPNASGAPAAGPPAAVEAPPAVTSPVAAAPASTAVPAVDTPPPPPATAPKFPIQKALNELAMQARRQGVKLSEAESQAGVDLMRDHSASAEDVVKTVAASRSPSGLTLSAEEQALSASLRTAGKSGAQVESAILKARALAKKLKTPATGAVEDAVARRNETGRWEKD